MNYIDRLNFSSPVIFAIILIVFTAGIAYFVDLITVVNLGQQIPEVMDQFSYVIRKHAFYTSIVVGVPCLSIFLMLLRRISDLNSQLEYQVRYDDLTGVLSRRTFLDEVHANFKDCSDRTNGALLIADADFFKKINDEHGHMVGDRSLVAIANALKSGIRNTDLVGRIGGEEFGILLRDVSPERAKEVSDRLCAAVKHASDQMNIDNLDLSVSIGAVAYDEYTDKSEIINIADTLLYEAKSSGRGRAVFQCHRSGPVTIGPMQMQTRQVTA